MMDRRVWGVVAGSCGVMLAGMAWRLSPLPQAWQLIGPGAEHNVRDMSQELLSAPFFVVMVTSSLAREGRRAAAWAAWAGSIAVGYCMLAVALQALLIADSLGMAPARAELGYRLFFGAIALLMLVGGNVIPKLPPVGGARGWTRRLGPRRMGALLRTRGRLVVALGAALLISAAALPLDWSVGVVGGGTVLGLVLMGTRALLLWRDARRHPEDGPQFC